MATVLQEVPQIELGHLTEFDELAPLAAPSRRKGYEPKYASRSIGHPNHETVVKTEQLQPIIEDAIAELGSVNDLALQAAQASGGALSYEAVCRRIFDIREGRTRAVRANLAECIVMAAGRSLRECELLQVPAGPAAARERILIWLDLRGGEMSGADVEDLAADLYEFALCVIHGPEEAAADEAEAA